MTTAPQHPPGTEAANAALLDSTVTASGLFNSYEEVPGTLIQPRPGQRDKGMRIDRLLVPSDKLISLGWTHGIVGVEIKRSDTKLGPPVAQAMDYSRSAFTLPGGGFQVMPSWVFLYPFAKEHGPLASVMAQHRIGTATTDQWTMLVLNCGGANVLRVSWSGEVRLGVSSMGLKAGSR